MDEVELKFEREDKSGLIAAGTYLFDAARRFGIEVEADCGRTGACDSCAMRVTGGKEFLTEPTLAEITQLNTERRENGERLSCQTKIEKAGEVVIMTTKKAETEEKKVEEKTEEYRKEFEELPLEKKVASLLELEAIALGETVSFVLNSPYQIFGKIMDVMAEFGLKMETDAKKAKRPNEHQTTEDAATKNASPTTKKKTSRKKDESSK